MILNSPALARDKFICLEYSNPDENAIINTITRLIFEQKQDSVKKCGAERNGLFATGGPYLVFLLTVEIQSFNIINTDGSVKTIYFDNIETDMHGKVIDSILPVLYEYMKTVYFLNSISSYCFLKDAPSYIEIYDVCIFSEKRGRGVGNVLIGNAVKLIRKNFWLYVLPDNIAAATLYIKNGFAVQKITQSDSSDVVVFDNIKLISMIFNQQSPSSDVDSNIQLFKRMSDKILGFVKAEHLNIKIESEVINFIDNLVKNPSISYEVGGCLMAKHINKFNLNIETKDGKSFIVLEMNKFLIKGSSNGIGVITTDYNFIFLTQPISISPFNYNGSVVQMPFIDDITSCVQRMLYNISKLIKTQKMFIFSFDGVISISISSILTQFILTCLEQSLEKGKDVHEQIFPYLQLCFHNLTTIKMASIYQQLVLQGLQTSVKKQTGDLICSFINSISIKDLADADPGCLMSNMLLIFFEQKGYLPVFSAKYHEIPESAKSEGLYISCEDTVVPRNLADLKYFVDDTVKPESFSLANDLTMLSLMPEYTSFVLE
jgi:ribosomal protein S18 acetylase RimI-like enzyme